MLPWGDKITSGTQLNFSDLSRDDSTSEINDGYPFTAPVGSYPDGVSFYGAMDMVGNVWEWTASLYKPYPYYVGGDAEDPNNFSDSRVLRGGAWDTRANEATCSNRYAPVPTAKTLANGFRVCVTQIR
jgi:formylglycine-generating enzyme required for sulfatase activity